MPPHPPIPSPSRAAAPRSIPSRRLVAPALLACAATLLAACGQVKMSYSGTPTPEAGSATAEAAAGTPTAKPTIDASVDRVVTADGALRYPGDPHTLAFGASGLLVELNVAEHDAVAAGEVLARLELLSLEAGVADARTALAQAEAQLAALETGSEITRARIQVEQAKNQLWGSQAQRDATCGSEDSPFFRQADCDAAQASVQAGEEGVKLAEEALRQAQATEASQRRAAEAQVASARLSLRQAETSLNRASLTAPFSGTVSALQVHLGEPISAGAPALTLTQTEPLRFVTDNLGERFVGDIRPDDPARITLVAYPDQPLEARVQRIDDQGTIDESGAVVFAVYLDVVPNPDIPLRAGMTGRVEITVGGREQDS